MIEKAIPTKTGQILWEFIDKIVDVNNNTITINDLNAFFYIPETFGLHYNSEKEAIDLLVNYIGEYGHYCLGLNEFIVISNLYKITFKGIFVTSIDNKPAIEISTHNNQIFSKRWYKNGVLHRDNGPSIIEKIPIEGHFRLVAFYNNGNLHRDDNLPSFLEFWGNTKIAQASWYKKGIMEATVNLKQGGQIHSIITDNTNDDNFYMNIIKDFHIENLISTDDVKGFLF